MRKRREIFIELTSLLDVIMILLFVLLTQAQGQSGAAVAEAAAARLETAALEEQLAEADSAAEQLRRQYGALEKKTAELQRHVFTDGLVEENSLVLTLSVQSDELRYILLEREGGGSQEIALDWETENYTVNKLRAALNGEMKDAGRESVFVVFQYDRNSIYYREVRLIDAVVREMKQQAREENIGLNYITLDISTIAD